MLKIGIISIGDEVCIGQIINTNAAWIARKCTEIGASVVLHLVSTDKKQDIIEALDYVRQKADYLIITGGLGPTHDDITKQVLAEYFDDELVFDVAVFSQLEEFFRQRKRQVTDKQKEQAMVPRKSKALRNRMGTAPGMLFQVDSKFIVSLPGVPIEMQTIMEDYILLHINDLIEKKAETVVKYKTFNTSGIPESILAELIGDVDGFMLQGESLAYLPSAKGVRLRIGAEGENFEDVQSKLDRLESHIVEKVKNYIHSVNDSSLSFAVGEMLSSRGLTLSVAESCTAGMLGAEIASIAGSSKYFIGGEIVYSNTAKIDRLNVNPKTIEDFGAVSSETAVELAENVRRIFKTDFGVSITGIAGPDGGTAEKPVGTVWIAISSANGTISEEFGFGADRQTNRERAVYFALYNLLKILREDT